MRVQISMAATEDERLSDAAVRLYLQLEGSRQQLRDVREEDRLQFMFEWAVEHRTARNQRVIDRLLRILNRLMSIRGIQYKAQSSSVNPEQYIRIAANTVGQLRKMDVERVLTESGIHAPDVAAYIVRSRPDLKAEVVEVMNDELDLPFKA